MIYIGGFMIRVHRLGYDSSHREYFEMKHPKGLPHYLLLLVKSPADFIIEGNPLFVPADSAMLFPPDTPLSYHGHETYFNDDWLHFSFHNEEPLPEKLGLPFKTPIPLPYIRQLTGYLKLMVTENYPEQLHREEVFDSLTRSLLYCLDSQRALVPANSRRQKHFEEFCRLRFRLLNTCHKKWTVADLAASVGMSPSYFQALYKEYFGVSCMNDLIQARVESSKFYLRTSDLPVDAVARCCGYESELHYMRQFKKITGLTPTQYRLLPKNRE